MARLARRGGGPAARADDRRADRLVRQDHDQGPVAQVTAQARPDGRARRFLQQRARATRTRCCSPRPQTRYLVLEMGARGIGHIRYLCEIGPAPDRRRAQRRRRAPWRVRFAGPDRAGKGRTGRGAARRRRGDPQRRRPPGRRDGRRVPSARVVAGRRVGRARRSAPRTSRLDERGRASYTLVTPEGSGPVRLGVSGRHQVGNTLVAAAVARELGVAHRTRSRDGSAICGWFPHEGWMSSTVPMMSRSSTTRTTPTRRRWRRR